MTGRIMVAAIFACVSRLLLLLLLLLRRPVIPSKDAHRVGRGSSPSLLCVSVSGVPKAACAMLKDLLEGGSVVLQTAKGASAVSGPLCLLLINHQAGCDLQNRPIGQRTLSASTFCDGFTPISFSLSNEPAKPPRTLSAVFFLTPAVFLWLAVLGCGESIGTRQDGGERRVWMPMTEDS